MARKDHLNPYQYKLFMTGDEIKGLVSDSVDRRLEYDDWDSEKGEHVTIPAETMEDLWNEKKSSLHRKVAATEGIKRHVTIQTNRDGSFTMGQGHHRVQASSDLAKEGRTIYVPVIYDDDWNYSGLEKDDYERMYPDVPKEGDI